MDEYFRYINYIVGEYTHAMNASQALGDEKKEAFYRGMVTATLNQIDVINSLMNMDSDNAERESRDNNDRDRQDQEKSSN